MDFVLVLHSHLPWVLGHGRWPHGSDWLCEAAVDTYLPLLERLLALEADDVPAPATIGITPILANQLRSPAFAAELREFLAQRLATCDEAPASLRATRDEHLLGLVAFWRERLERLRALFESHDGDLAGAFRRLAERGRIELIASGATHGYLPLLGRDESIRLQLLLGAAEHTRIFGRAPTGCWLPECAYRPGGPWSRRPGHPPVARPGIEEHLAAAGFRYVVVDSHLAHAGAPLGAYEEIPLGAERFDAERHDHPHRAPEAVERSPYRTYRIGSRRGVPPVAAFVRDPKSSLQVWSRQHGYPGDEWYLEFHKIRWPGGLKLWRVTGPHVDLGDKRPYDPAAARDRAGLHAMHFTDILAGIAHDAGKRDGVIVAPFDTELLGHWWFEGVDFLGGLYSGLRHQRGVRPVTADEHLGRHPTRTTLRLAAGSWGANGDDTMWLNPGTETMWRRLWPLEDAFWSVVPGALANPAAHAVLAQAARELLLAQASDWEFIVSTGAAGDYAERRFAGHCDGAERLVAALGPGAGPDRLGAATQLAEELGRHDDPFPDVLAAVARAVEVRQRATAAR